MRRTIYLSIFFLFFPYIVNASLSQSQCDQYISFAEGEWNKSSNRIAQSNSCNPENKERIIASLENAINHCNEAIRWYARVCEGFNPGKKNVTFLEPHEDASWFDHDITSPTFKDEIKRKIKKYIE